MARADNLGQVVFLTQMKHCFIMLDNMSLAALAAIVREGSFEKAAHSLGMTPSAVSQRIRGFEERLGAVLVVRGQPCIATDRGRALCAHFDKVRLLEADLSPILGKTAASDGIAPTLKVAVNADSLATWFPKAIVAFAHETGMLIELMLEDETRTADRLRSGDVLAAVTSDPAPVHGCRTVALGALPYAACASLDFIERHFKNGVDAESLATAPYMRFNRHDVLQARWVQEAHGVSLKAPTHWIPSTQGFLDLALSGLAWGLQPRAIAQSHLDIGRLIELPPAKAIEVPLFWTVARLETRLLRGLTDAVRRSAAAYLEN